jgi:hypothetical protein
MVGLCSRLQLFNVLWMVRLHQPPPIMTLSGEMYTPSLGTS